MIVTENHKIYVILYVHMYMCTSTHKIIIKLIYPYVLQLYNLRILSPVPTLVSHISSSAHHRWGPLICSHELCRNWTGGGWVVWPGWSGCLQLHTNTKFRSSLLDTRVFQCTHHQSDHELVISTICFKIKTKHLHSKTSSPPHTHTHKHMGNTHSSLWESSI